MSLTEFLVQLDEKMDKIIRLLGGDKLEKDIRVSETLNISGSGIRMMVSASVDVGQLLQISSDPRSSQWVVKERRSL